MEDFKKEKLKFVLVVLFFFPGAAEEESWFRLLMGFFVWDLIHLNVFPDPADGADDGVWILHIIVVGGHWMDGWEGSAGRERV